MKRTLTVLFICLSLTGLAQEKNKQSIILNDGSTISGTIVSNTHDSIRIVITKPETISISKNEIKDIEGSWNPEQLLSKSKGYFIYFSPSIFMGKNNKENLYTISFNLSNGYQLSNGLGIGFGVGVEQMGAPLLPVYTEITYHPWNKQLSPFVYLKSGYGFAFGRKEEQIIYYDYAPYSASNYKGGFLFNAGIGLANFTWLKSAVTIGVGYRYQRVTSSEQYSWNGGIIETVTNFNRVELKFGFLFK